jgi:hypothetical protein
VAATLTDRTALLAELAPRFARTEPSADAGGEYVQGATWFANMLAVSTPGASRAFRDRARQVSAAAGRDDLLVWGYLHVMEGIYASLIEEAPWSGMTRMRRARDMFQAVGEQRFQQGTRALLGKALHELGDPTGAEAELRDSLAQADRIGAGVSQVYVRMYLARLLAQTAPLDRLDEPEALAREVIAAKNTSLAGPAHGVLAEIRRRRGDLVDAEREARAGCEAARAFPSYACRAIALHARILIERGRAEEALAAAEAGVEELERLGFEGNGEIDLRLSLAEALHAVGRVEAARAALADAIPHLKKRLEDIPEPAARARYLTSVRANARMVALAEAWLGEEAVRALGP